MRILSIDFDYFIGTDIYTRNEKFPDGVDEKPKEVLLEEWNIMYSKYPEIKDIGVINDFHTCLRKLVSLKNGKVLISQSHKDISKIFPLINEKESLEVVHIDFHHDNYISSGSKLDCANWVRHLKEIKPDTDILWIRRCDSETFSLEGEYPYKNSLDFNITGEFDYIFICLSPEWTPPHLEHLFDKMCECVGHLTHM